MNTIVKAIVSAVPAIVMSQTLDAQTANPAATQPSAEPAQAQSSPATGPAVASAGQSDAPLVIPDGTSLQNPRPPERSNGFGMRDGQGANFGLRG